MKNIFLLFTLALIAQPVFAQEMLTCPLALDFRGLGGTKKIIDEYGDRRVIYKASKILQDLGYNPVTIHSNRDLQNNKNYFEISHTHLSDYKSSKLFGSHTVALKILDRKDDQSKKTLVDAKVTNRYLQVGGDFYESMDETILEAIKSLPTCSKFVDKLNKENAASNANKVAPAAEVLDFGQNERSAGDPFASSAAE